MSALAWIADQLTQPAGEVSEGAQRVVDTVEEFGAMTYAGLAHMTGFSEHTIRRWSNEAAAADLVDLVPGRKRVVWVTPRRRYA